MKGLYAADVDVVQDRGRNKDEVQAFRTSAVRVGFALNTMVTGMNVHQVALCHEVTDTIGSVT